MDILEGISLAWAFVGAGNPQVGCHNPHLGRTRRCALHLEVREDTLEDLT